MMKLKLIIYLSCLLSFLLDSQNTKCQQPVMSSFRDFFPPKGPLAGKEFRMNEMKEAVSNGKKTVWIVYADRNGIQTYKTPDEKNPLKKINFMDAFFVISSNDNGRLLQIVNYNADIMDFNTRRLNDRYQESRDYFGWVESEKMLLWENALIDPGSRSTIKAISAFTPELFSDLPHYVNEYAIKSYKSPDLVKSESQIIPYTIYYIYKQSDKSSLIGLKENISPADAKRKIAGWVPNDVINTWKQRLCFEVNADNGAAVSERSSANITPAIFLKKEDAIKFKSNQPADSAIVLLKYANDEKWRGNKMRLPVLEIDSQGIFKTAVITDINGVNPNIDILRNEKQEKKEIKSNSNIIFILSGKDNVRSIYAKIYLAVKETLQKESSKSNTACIIYNGESDEQCRINPAPSELTPDLNKTINYIKNLQQSSLECGQTFPDDPYALYQALQTSAKMLKGHEGENNLLVIIGDAGSSKSTVSQMEEKLITDLKNVHTNFLVIQLSNPGTEVYDGFYRQTKRIAEGTAAQLNLANENFKTAVPQIEIKNSSELGMEGWDVYEFNPTTSIISGRFLFPSTDVSLTINLISENFNTSLSQVNKSINSSQNTAEKNAEPSQNIPAGINLVFKEMGYNAADPAFIKKISRYPFALTGYSSTNQVGLDNYIFKQNILVNQSEFIYIGTMLKNLTEGSDLAAIRKNMTEVFKKTSEDYFSYNPDDPVLLNKTLDEVLYFVIGLHSKNELFKKYHIKDLNNVKKITDAELQVLVNVIQTKREKLNALLTSKNNLLDMDGSSFYWVPEESLP